VVKARVVGARKGDHELAGVLVHAVHRNAMSLKKNGKIDWILLIGLSKTLIKVSVIWSSNIKERKKRTKSEKVFLYNFKLFLMNFVGKFSKLSRKQPFLFM
jgi:hypothetical protein